MRLKVAFAVLALGSVGLCIAPVRAAQRKPAPASVPKPAAPSATRSERAVPFKVGETLTYDVSWSNFLTAGTATITVREKKPSYGSTAYYIVAEAHPSSLLSRLYSLYYKADTLLDAYTLESQRGSVFSQEGGKTRFKATQFNRPAGLAKYEVGTASVTTTDLKLAANTQDALAAIFMLRTMPLKVGSAITMPVTETGKMYRVRAVVQSQEALQTSLGTIRAWKIAPSITDPNGQTNDQATVWISDDARRLPLRIEAKLAVGSLNLALRQAGGV